MYSAARARSSGGRPDTRAAASGESGSGNRASSWVSVTPDSRVTVSTSGVSEPGPVWTPVCAGLTTATRWPRASRERGDRGGDHGLADAGAGAGDDEDAVRGRLRGSDSVMGPIIRAEVSTARSAAAG